MFGLYTRKEVERREWERDRECWTGERFERLERRVWVLEKKLSKLTGEPLADDTCNCVAVPPLDVEDIS